MKDDVKMVQDPPRVDVDASVINRSMLVFISMRKFLTKCNVCYALDNLFCTRLMRLSHCSCSSVELVHNSCVLLRWSKNSLESIS